MINQLIATCFLYAFLFSSCLPAFTQKDDLKFIHLTTEKGLSNSECRMVVQDKEGFIWIGTADGLNRYDGIEFKVYRKIIHDPTSLPGNAINALYVDSQGVLWVGTSRGGLCKYIKEKDSFVTFKENNADSTSINDNSISGITEDSKKRLWIATFSGLNLYDRKNNDFIRYSKDPKITLDEKGLQNLSKSRIPNQLLKKLQIFVNQTIPLDQLLQYLKKSVNSDIVNKFTGTITSNAKISFNDRTIARKDLKTITRDAKGNILIGYPGSTISIFNPDTRIFHHYSIPGNKKNENGYTVFTICPDGNKLWVGTYGDGVWIFNTVNHSWRKFNRIQELFITKIIKDSNGNFWFSSSDNGLLIYNPKLNTIKHYKHDEFDKYSITANSILDTYEDRQHNFWICEKQGALDLTLKSMSFASFRQSPIKNKGLTYNNVTSVLEDNENNLWVGFYNSGIDIINRKTLVKKYLRYDRNSAQGLGEGTVQCMFKDRESRIWIGTYRGGLQMYDKKNDQFITYVNNPDNDNSISGNDVRKITEDKEGDLWIATQGTGINKFNPKTKIFRHYRVDYANRETTICTDWVTTVFCDNKDNIWVGTNYGISCICKNSRYIKSYYNEPGNDKSLSNNIVLCIFQDSRGNMWFGTSEGLNLFDPKTGTFRVFTRKDGLPNDNITGIVEDDKDNLWISTFKGLSKFSLKDYSTTNFDITNGLETDEFLNPSGYKDRKGEIFFGGRQGLVCFYPDSIKFNTNKPPVYFTDFKIFNKSVPIRAFADPKSFCLKSQITYLQNIVLNYDQNDFTFGFAALNYIFPEKNQYSYILQGFDDHWNNIGFKHDVTFTNLPPGNYVFKVKASNNDGIWNKSGASIKIRIKPPWWRTYWAYVLYLTGCILLLLWFRYSILQRENFRRNLEYERIEAKKQQELISMKLRFFSNITHEFRTPLTLILAPIQKLMNSTGKEFHNLQVDLIYRNAKRLLRLINQLMDISKLEAEGLKLDVSQNDIVRFVKEIAGSFSFEAQERNISYTIIANEKSIEVWFDRDKMDKILYNLISNAFKFTTDGGEITIHIQTEKNESGSNGHRKDHVTIIIEDNGIGIPRGELSRVFERFYQAETTHLNQGTGLGLALTKEFVELHHGVIKVQSDPSKGTQFEVELPMGNEHFENYEFVESKENQDIITSLLEIESNPDSIRKNIDTASEKINFSRIPVLLIVEDNNDLRSFIKNEFNGKFRVIEAKDGIAGMEMAFGCIPDLIISDVMMPKMEGFELCRKLKTDERTCHIPLIMLTAISTEEKVVNGFETGADDYIVKPFSLSVLKARVNNLIESRQLLWKQFSKYGEMPKSEIMPTNLDQKFLKRAYDTINKHIPDAEYNANRLSVEMGISRSLLYKKMQALTGLSVHEFMRNMRLKKAAELLESKNYNVSETAIEVGFNDLSYFIKCFSKQYGVTPSKYTTHRDQKKIQVVK